MKYYHLLVSGDLLQLKSERQAAYGLQSPIVGFVRIVERKGYKVPWIVAMDATQSHGHFKPQDFIGKV